MTLPAAGKKRKDSEKNHDVAEKNHDGLAKHQKRDPSGGLTMYNVAALTVFAIVIISTMLITKSAEAVTIATAPLLAVIGVWAGRRYLGRRDE
jgi:hypothetical protein